MTPEIATAIVLALGGASIVPKVIDAIKALHSGRALREKAENRSAFRQLDREADFRRRVEEWGGRLVYMLIQLGVPEDKIPPKPERKT